jgi:hypothetical protein
MSQRITIDPVTRIEVIYALIAKLKTAWFPVPGHREPCGAEWKRL